MLSHLSHSKASNRYRRATVHSLPVCQSASRSCLPVCLCKIFSIFDHCLVTHPRPSMEWGRGHGRGRLPEISISRKSALLSRHNSMGFICVCHFLCCLPSTSLLLFLLLLFFISILLPPPHPIPLLAPSQLFFIVANPEASRLVNCVQREGSLCVCRQFGASNH